jgi:hypothetical protein
MTYSCPVTSVGRFFHFKAAVGKGLNLCCASKRQPFNSCSSRKCQYLVVPLCVGGHAPAWYRPPYYAASVRLPARRVRFG